MEVLMKQTSIGFAIKKYSFDTPSKEHSAEKAS